MFRWTIHLKGGHNNFHHAAVVVGHKLYSFGRYLNNSDQIDVHIFNTVSLCWRKLPPVTNGRGERPVEVPNMCSSHTAVLIEDLVYIWGGFPYCNIIYTFDVDTNMWFNPKVSGTIPGARKGHSACALGKVMYIYGGYTQLIGRTNDIYKLDTTTMVWSLINTRGTPPPDSLSQSATIFGTKMFVFGGRRGQRVYNNITVFDTETNCWLITPSAHLISKAPCCHSAFAYKGKLYTCGGCDRNQDFNAMWRFNPETFSWTKVEPKGKGPCSGMYKMCCCMVGDRVMIFGGWDLRDELYVLDFSPTMKTLCKMAVIQYNLEQSELPHDIRWELAAMSCS